MTVYVMRYITHADDCPTCDQLLSLGHDQAALLDLEAITVSAMADGEPHSTTLVRGETEKVDLAEVRSQIDARLDAKSSSFNDDEIELGMISTDVAGSVTFDMELTPEGQAIMADLIELVSIDADPEDDLPTLADPLQEAIDSGAEAVAIAVYGPDGVLLHHAQEAQARVAEALSAPESVSGVQTPTEEAASPAPVESEDVADDLEAQRDALVDAWHQGAGEGQELHEFLGMTREEYAEWILPSPETLAEIREDLGIEAKPRLDAVRGFGSIEQVEQLAAEARADVAALADVEPEVAQGYVEGTLDPATEIKVAHRAMANYEQVMDEAEALLGRDPEVDAWIAGEGITEHPTVKRGLGGVLGGQVTHIGDVSMPEMVAYANEPEPTISRIEFVEDEEEPSADDIPLSGVEPEVVEPPRNEAVLGHVIYAQQFMSDEERVAHVEAFDESPSSLKRHLIEEHLLSSGDLPRKSACDDWAEELSKLHEKEHGVS